MIDLYLETLPVLQRAFHVLENKIEKSAFVKRGTYSKEIHRTLSQTFSGYVHGASSHIMEMYGGDPPRYYLAGMIDTPLIASCTENIFHYFHRGLMSVMFVAGSFGEQKLLQDLYTFRGYFEEKSGRTEWEHPEKMIKKMKGKKV
ncbi:MAG: hypothetical protein FJ264_04390 [Planctomycetes bacterium]|nr:hypothetical protein [Planctomycetota bacterium]